MVTASDRSAVSFSLSGGAKHDSPEGMKLLFFTPACRIGQSLLMDRAYEGDKMRAVAKKLGYNPVVPLKKNRIDPRGDSALSAWMSLSTPSRKNLARM